MLVRMSSFGNLRHIPETWQRLSICRFPPDSFADGIFNPLLPDEHEEEHWRYSEQSEEDWKRFRTAYKNKLRGMDAASVMHQLYEICKYTGKVVLLSKEKPDEHNYRRIAAVWFRHYGYDVKEWEGK